MSFAAALAKWPCHIHIKEILDGQPENNTDYCTEGKKLMDEAARPSPIIFCPR